MIAVKKPIKVHVERAEEKQVIHTLEGDMIANKGDYIITGVKGEKYPCKKEIFEETYDFAENINNRWECLQKLRNKGLEVTPDEYIVFYNCRKRITHILNVVCNKGRIIGFTELDYLILELLMN